MSAVWLRSAPGEDMAIKVIVELHAKQGRRGELAGLLETLVREQGPGPGGVRFSGARGSVYVAPDNVREEYWRSIRSLPENASLASFRSLGVHGKHATR